MLIKSQGRFSVIELTFSVTIIYYLCHSIPVVPLNDKLSDIRSEQSPLIDKRELAGHILVIRDCKIMLDRDIAVYFGTSTGNLNRAMKRNISRFPPEFCFQLTDEECSRFQIGILNGGRGSNLKYLPYA